MGLPVSSHLQPPFGWSSGAVVPGTMIKIPPAADELFLGEAMHGMWDPNYALLCLQARTVHNLILCSACQYCCMILSSLNEYWYNRRSAHPTCLVRA